MMNKKDAEQSFNSLFSKQNYPLLVNETAREKQSIRLFGYN